MNKEIYNEEINYKSESVFGNFEKKVKEGQDPIFDCEMVKHFMMDNDIQEIKFYSTNVGFVKTLTKEYKNVPEKPPLGKAEP